MIQYREGYKYQLAYTAVFKTRIRPSVDIITEFIRLYTDGTLILMSGYAWDGASGPTIDTKTSMRGALIHDAFYQLMRQGHLSLEFRQDVDDEFLRYLLLDGMWSVRANLWHRSVHRWAASAANPKHRKKILRAP